MTLLAFGRQQLEPNSHAYAAARSIIEGPSTALSRVRREKSVVFGCDAVYEDFVVLQVTGEGPAVCTAFSNWITLQMTRRGFSLVPGLVTFLTQIAGTSISSIR